MKKLLLKRSGVVKKRILIFICILVLISTVCLAGQSARSVKRGPFANASYKTALVNNVKGSVEEVPLAILGPETKATIIIAKNEQRYTVSFWSAQPLSNLYARPPPE